nr:amidohydrolase family protein [Succinivibrionaceae bacterium]
LHVHPSAVRMLSRCIGPTGLIMISDSMRATGLPDGDYTLGGQKVIVKSGAARLESGTLAGSVRDLRDIFVTAVKEMGMPLELALRAVTANPARAIGLGKTIGAIAPGLLADLVLLDDDLEIRMVVLRGKVLVRKI